VGQYETTKKKSPETANNRPAQAAPGAAPASRRRAAPGALRVPAAPVPTSRLRAAPRPRRVAPGAPRVTAAPVNTSRLRAAPGAPRVTAAPFPTSWLKAAPGPARVSCGPAPASRCRTAPGMPRVPAALGRMKTVESSSLENRAPDDFFLHPPPGVGQLWGLRMSPRLRAERKPSMQKT
jgi:hypothetical protein